MSSSGSSRARAAAAGLAAAAGALLLVGVVWSLQDDGADPRWEAAAAYVEQVNDVQRSAAIELDRAATLYERLELDPAALARVEPELVEAEESLSRLLRRVRALRPPREAEEVQAELLEFLALQVSLAGELTDLARYVPRWTREERRLSAATERLRRDLAQAETGAAQQAAFTRYRRSLGEVVAGLDEQSAPPLLEPSRKHELARLRRIGGFTAELERALADERAEDVQRLFERLAGASGTTGSARAQRAAVAAHNRRLRQLGDQRARVERAVERLNAEVG